MKEFQDILTFIQTLLADPSSFELHRHENEEKLSFLVNAFADARPPTIEQMIEELEDQYPGLQTSHDLIEKGDTLRTEMMEKVFAEDFEVDEVKKYEARISLFDKMIAFDGTINMLIKNIGGTYVPSKKKGKIKVEVDGSQGSAQTLLNSMQDGKKI